MVIRGAIIGERLATRALRKSLHFLGQPKRDLSCRASIGWREDEGDARGLSRQSGEPDPLLDSACTSF